MAQVLVTGGAGFIGSHLATKLVELGHRVRVLDDLSSGSKGNLAHVKDAVELIVGDVCDADVCNKACDKVDYVFHEAAVPSVPKSVNEPVASHFVNMTGTFNMLHASAKAGVHRFIFAASSSAYGDVDISPKHENIKPEPLSPYAVQKLAGEHYCRSFSECFGLETISLRYFNVFGERQDPASQYAAAIPAFVGAILAGDRPTVYGDGEQTRDFTYVANVVHGNMLAMQTDKTHGEAVNVACGASISVNAVIASIATLLGVESNPQYVERRVGDVMHSFADISLARTLLGYESTVSLEEGLGLAIDYYRSLEPTS